MDMKREDRIDRAVLRFDGPVERDSRGYARIWGTVISADQTLSYQRADGRDGDRVEFVPESTVNDGEAIDTLLHSPITNGHPSVMLDAKNTARHQVGSVIDTRYQDGKLQALGLFTDSGVLGDIESGKVETSPGYTALIDQSPGVHEGVKYDAVQRKRRYNHWAIVTRARAGSANSLHFDGTAPSDLWVAKLDERPDELARSTDGNNGDDMKETDEKTDNSAVGSTTEQTARMDGKAAFEAMFQSFGPAIAKDAATAAADKVLEGLRSDESKRNDEAEKAAESNKAIAFALKSLPDEYKADGKEEAEILGDAVAAVNKGLKDRADSLVAESRVGELRVMLETALAAPKATPPSVIPKDFVPGQKKRADAKDSEQDRLDAMSKAFRTTRVGGRELCLQMSGGEAA